jgi:DNA modification methylase
MAQHLLQAAYVDSVAHAEQIIDAFCPEGGTVLDPMCGAATVCIAASKKGRKSIGIELDTARFQRAEARIGQTGEIGKNNIVKASSHVPAQKGCNAIQG